MLTLKPVSCVIARAGETGAGGLAIADVVADHRPAAAGTAARAAGAFARLPGCEIFLAPGRHGYLAFTRRGECFEIRPSRGRRPVPPGAAEACAAALYARACAGYPASLARTSSA